MSELNEKALEAAFHAYDLHDSPDAEGIKSAIQAYLASLPQSDYEAQVEKVAAVVWSAHQGGKWFNIKSENCEHSKELAKAAIQAIMGDA